MKQFNVAVLMTLALATSLAAGEPKELAAAKAEFAKVAHPDEAARVKFVLSLSQLRQKLAHSGGDWEAVDAELRRHPAPKDADAKTLTNLHLGGWSSPRHDYLFRKDGTWSMLPLEPDATQGRWHIDGNVYFENAEGEKPGSRKYTIILLNEKNFIYTDGEVVFYETRKGK